MKRINLSQNMQKGESMPEFTLPYSADRIKPAFLNAFHQAEAWLERKRDQLPLFIPVGLGVGIILWQYLGNPALWPLFLATIGILCCAIACGSQYRLSRLCLYSALIILAGFAAITFKATYFAVPALQKIWTGQIQARVLTVEDHSARDMMRVVLDTDGRDGLPPKIRVNVPLERMVAELEPGVLMTAKVRLMPPPGPALPGGYDFARYAWFQGLGATGSVISKIEIQKSADDRAAFWSTARERLARHIRTQMPGESGAIGAGLLVGSRGAISESDNEALRNSGMAHLLSVSGLHVTAVVGATFLIISRLLALFPWLALRIRIPLTAAGVAAVIAIFYTLLSGSEVPTIRSCIAALLVLFALFMGREALSMRLLIFGATVVLIFWPESLAGPSFQLSFAAVATIIFLHESPIIRRWTEPRDEMMLHKFLRFLFSLLLTGLAIEIILAPITLFHFHKSGFYGALANIIAIPLTTFFVMPMQILGLIGDVVGIGIPFWALAAYGVDGIRVLAHWVSAAPGSVMLLPAFPNWAFGFVTAGIIWIMMIGGRSAYAGLPFIVAGALAMAIAPRPDMLLTGDGRHLAVINEQNELVLLRPGAGDYAVDQLSENAALSGEVNPLESMDNASCSTDVCTFAISKAGRNWIVLATRSDYLVPAMEMAAACKRSDIVISNRRLPYSCKPRWLKADRAFLEQSGGLAFYLKENRIKTVAETTAHYPWSQLKRNVSNNMMRLKID
jgi:competence protein ComEC